MLHSIMGRQGYLLSISTIKRDKCSGKVDFISLEFRTVNISALICVSCVHDQVKCKARLNNNDDDTYLMNIRSENDCLIGLVIARLEHDDKFDTGVRQR